METKWLLILWFVAGSSGPPSMKGDIYNIAFEDVNSCKNALIAIRKESKKHITGVCTPNKSEAPRLLR